jgi:uncharacterized protein (DUF3820 family)
MEDTDLMPFGIHKGKAMANVPAHYLIWIYENKKCGEPVKQYVKDNLEVLKAEVKKNQKSNV